MCDTCATLNRNAASRITCDYGQDVGNCHCIDYRLWLAELPLRPGCAAPFALRFSPADWSRP